VAGNERADPTRYGDEVFEGLFGPWHLLIIAAVVFVVVGPRKLAASMRGTAESVQRLVDPDEYPPDEPGAEPDAVQRAKLSYRLGRRLRRRR
jgi:hypothetical protein